MTTKSIQERYLVIKQYSNDLQNLTGATQDQQKAIDYVSHTFFMALSFLENRLYPKDLADEDTTMTNNQLIEQAEAYYKVLRRIEEQPQQYLKIMREHEDLPGMKCNIFFLRK